MTERAVLQCWSMFYGQSYQSNYSKIFKSKYLLLNVIYDNTALVLTELVLESGISDDTELCFLGREAQ